MDPAAVLCYVGPIVAAIGLLFCFPNQPRAARWAGAVVVVIGVAAATYGLVNSFHLSVLPATVITMGVAAVLLAGRMITHANPVYSALYFGGVVLCTSVLVLVLGAHFLAAILVIVYAGAILVAYVFVIMLAMQAMPLEYNIDVRQPVFAVAAGLGLIVAVTFALMYSQFGATRDLAAAAPGPVYSSAGAASEAGRAIAAEGNVVSLGSVLFGNYPVSIELAGVFLLIAMVGAIVLAGMRINGQQEQKF